MQMSALTPAAFLPAACMPGISMPLNSPFQAQGTSYASTEVSPTAAMAATPQPDQASKKRKSLELKEEQQPASKLRLKETLTGSSVGNRPPLAIKPPKGMGMFPSSTTFPMSPMPFGPILPAGIIPPGPPLPAGMTWGVPAPPPALLMSMMSAMAGGFPGPVGFPFPMGPMPTSPTPGAATALPPGPPAFLPQQMPFNPMMAAMPGACMQPGVMPGSLPGGTVDASACMVQPHMQPHTTPSSSTATSSPLSDQPSPLSEMSAMSDTISGPSASPCSSQLCTFPSGPSITIPSDTAATIAAVVSTPDSAASLLMQPPVDSSVSDFFNLAATGSLGSSSLEGTLPVFAASSHSVVGDSIPANQSPPSASPVKPAVPLPLPCLSPIAESVEMANAVLATSAASLAVLSAEACSPSQSGSADIDGSVDASQIGSFTPDKVSNLGTDSGDSSFADCLSDLGMMAELEEASLIPMDWLFEDDDADAARPVDLSALGLSLKKTGSFVDLINDSLWCNSACSAS